MLIISVYFGSDLVAPQKSVILAKETTTIGRENCDITISNCNRLSRLHCTVIKNNASVTMVDGNGADRKSTWGIRVNNVKFESIPLFGGTVVSLMDSDNWRVLVEYRDPEALIPNSVSTNGSDDPLEQAVIALERLTARIERVHDSIFDRLDEVVVSQAALESALESAQKKTEEIVAGESLERSRADKKISRSFGTQLRVSLVILFGILSLAIVGAVYIATGDHAFAFEVLRWVVGGFVTLTTFCVPGFFGDRR